MTEQMYAIDSSIWIEYFEGRLSEDLRQLIETQTIITASIGLSEISSKFAKVGLDSKKQLEFLKGRSLIIELNADLAIDCGKSYVDLRKKKPKISLADTIHIITAKKHDALLITCDRDFIGIDNVRFVMIPNT